MTRSLTADQRLFRESTRDYLERSMPVDAVRRLGESAAGFDRDWWRAGAALGWTAMLVPEELGGGTISGLPLLDLSMVAQEFGRACAPGPLITTSAVLTGLARAGDRCADTVAAVLAGERIAAWAVSEPQRSVLFEQPVTRAEPHGTGYRITGVKELVESGDQADVFLVIASGPDGPVQLLVPADAPGVTVSTSWTLDLVRHLARVEFADVAVGADAVVQHGEAAADAARAQLRVAATLAAAETVGATDRAFAATLQWMFDRYSFGRSLASYQALKHRMADNKTWLEACHATAWAAAAAADTPAAAETVSAAKSYIGDKAPAIVQDCVQLHGGIGVTWEHDMHLYLRRVTVNRALYGTPAEHRRLITNLLDGSAA
jgi:alkylation response protein AidB-like acyl-CoA dehydrogenase